MAVRGCFLDFSENYRFDMPSVESKTYSTTCSLSIERILMNGFGQSSGAD